MSSSVRAAFGSLCASRTKGSVVWDSEFTDSLRNRSVVSLGVVVVVEEIDGRWAV